MDAIPLTVDGYLDTEPVPGFRSTARFRLISSPTEDVTEETVLACTTGDPRIVDVLLNELQPGDLLRVSGILTLPGASSGVVQLHVDALEVLQTVPLTLTETVEEAEAAQELTMARYGAYVAISRSDTSAVPVWTETGAWVGTATEPAALEDLITAYEKATRNP